MSSYLIIDYKHWLALFISDKGISFPKHFWQTLKLGSKESIVNTNNSNLSNFANTWNTREYLWNVMGFDSIALKKTT